MKSKLIKAKYMIRAAEKEFNLYKKYKRFTNLSQACEKSWVTFTLMLEYISRRELRNHAQIRETSYSLHLELLYTQTIRLHEIHYEGNPSLRDEDMIIAINDTITRLKRLITNVGERK